MNAPFETCEVLIHVIQMVVYVQMQWWTSTRMFKALEHVILIQLYGHKSKATKLCNEVIMLYYYIVWTLSIDDTRSLVPETIWWNVWFENDFFAAVSGAKREQARQAHEAQPKPQQFEFGKKRGSTRKVNENLMTTLQPETIQFSSLWYSSMFKPLVSYMCFWGRVGASRLMSKKYIEDLKICV